jgi:FKBP-type peptidyl-prolyl cis-trans isomerase
MFLMKKITITVVMLSLALLISACNEEAKKEAAVEVPKAIDLTSEKAKLSYAIGYQFGRTLKDTKISDDVDSNIASQAMLDTVADKAVMTEEDVVATLTAYQKRKNDEAVAEAAKLEAEALAKAEKRQADGVTFLEANKAKEGVVTTESGLQYSVTTAGEGASPQEDSTVEVNYKGTLVDGTVFDSSYDRNQSAEFPVGGVIPGFNEGMLLIREGVKHTLYIPSDLAYGKQAPPTIGPDQMLIFEVELLKVK